ncbi:B3 domain-containing protein-like [Iris pallida]|uniref:B3 domain-containing protein-like n=1 Tax=Iris pallida TaxID=29817 RepID=A0AAX6H7M5_IRIPA|nr:B3 domain-containing protein-like [Iris pallida]
MAERIEGFKEFAGKYYWEHMRRFRFLKVMNHGFDLLMFIPEKFARNCKEELSENLVLKGPSGNLWLVKLLKVDGELLFKNGWKEFVEAHNVEKGDILSFEYEGNSCFNVLIYDRTSRCERETSYFARNHKNILADKACQPKKRNMEDAMENMHSPPPNNDASHSTETCSDDNQEVQQQSPQQFPMPNGRAAAKPLSIAWDGGSRKRRKHEASVDPKDTAESMHKSLPNNIETDSPRVSSDGNPQAQQISAQTSPAADGTAASKSLSIPGADNRRKVRRGKSAVRSNKTAMKSVKQEAAQTCENSGYVVQLISNRRAASDEEKARAWELANAINPANPFFRIEMRKTHVYSNFFMSIPSEFVTEHFPLKCHAVDLRIQNGKSTWCDVTFSNHQKCSRGLTGLQWRSFVDDNNLQEGDVCIFELSNTGNNLVFDVQIFHAVNEVTPFLLKKK